MFVEDLYATVERVGNDNIFVHAKTETMWRVELAETSAWLTDLAPTMCTECRQYITFSMQQELQCPPFNDFSFRPNYPTTRLRPSSPAMVHGEMSLVKTRSMQHH